jgi:hypothetical protein
MELILIIVVLVQRRILGAQPRPLVTDVSRCSEVSKHRRVPV